MDQDPAVSRDNSPESSSSKSILSEFLTDKYALYVIFMITLTYSSNQLNRYILTSVSEGLESGIGFGSGNGESFEYGMLAGPITTMPFCLGMVVSGHLGDRFNKVCFAQRAHEV